MIGTPTGIYATFVMAIVASEDQSRTIWPSCPANGWTAGVNRLTAQPNGSPLGLLPRLAPPKDDGDDAEPQRVGIVAGRASNCSFQVYTIPVIDVTRSIQSQG